MHAQAVLLPGVAHSDNPDTIPGFAAKQQFCILTSYQLSAASYRLFQLPLSVNHQSNGFIWVTKGRRMLA
jgi:hypothetical protein